MKKIIPIVLPLRSLNAQINRITSILLKCSIRTSGVSQVRDIKNHVDPKNVCTYVSRRRERREIVVEIPCRKLLQNPSNFKYNYKRDTDSWDSVFFDSE